MVNEGHSSENQNSLAYLPHSSSTRTKQGGWRAVKYILWNETFEKVASMGLIANLIVYLRTQYNMDATVSAEVFNVWSGSTNFLPLLGAYLADAYMGKFYVLLFGSIASFLGMGFVSLGAGISSLRPPSCPSHSDCIQANGTQLAILYLGLGLFAVGSGGLRPCNIAFGADQFDIKTEEGRALLDSFFNWWYFLFSIALLVALTVVVYIQTNVSWFLGFIIPNVCFAFSLTIFLLGLNTYVRLKPKGSIISDLVKVVVTAIRRRHIDINKDFQLSLYDPPPSTSESEQNLKKLAHTNRFRFFDKAAVITDQSERDSEGKCQIVGDYCSVQQVEELKSILATLPVWFAGIMCFLSMGQANSFGILQALQTNKSIGHHFSVPPAWMGLVPMIALSLWILIYEKIYIPWTKKTSTEGKRLSIERRILIGILFSIASMVVSGLIEVHRRDNALKHGSFESPTSIWWLVPQFALSGMVEAFAAVPMMELLTSHWPESMKTLGGATFFLSLAIANYLSTILIRIISVTTRNSRTPWLGGNDLNKNRLEYYYYTIAVFGGLNLLYFQFFARRYLHNEVLQTPARNEPQDVEHGHQP
ncbi:hypothetical protein VNO77_20408 [Canavalia gladiata]|uniref:Uncharacterized protein n=1 Tax=Canavalia gladiata TaxID=3824 RepID=A0AAN9LTH7_CANGL